MDQRQWLFFIIVLVCLFSPLSVAKKRCKPLLLKLQNIQAMQRNGYSVKRGLSLRDREDKARDKWWQCEQGKTQTKKKSKQPVSNSQTAQKSKKQGAKSKNQKIIAPSPFKTTQAIAIKSKYQGQKKRAWLIFYQQPAQCQRPKNLSVFAFCSEDKQSQRLVFEQQYK